MADENDDEWLYGNSDQNITEQEGGGETSTTDFADDKNGENQNVALEPPVIPPLEKSVTEESEEHPEINTEINQDTQDTNEAVHEQKESEEGETAVEEKDKAKESDDDEDDDDNINVVIGDLKTTPGYGPGLHIKRGNLLTATKQPGKFSADDFDSIGTINGVAAHEYNLDALEEKPWRKPGADISDYFNYGFNEDTWKAYCERQKRLRIHESGSGLLQLNQQPVVNVQQATLTHIPQVMTADRRDYVRKSFPQDMSVPPPMIPPPFQSIPTAPPSVPPPTYMNTYAGPSEYYSTNLDPYYQPTGYNGMHESWMEPPAREWNTNNVIPLTNSGNNREIQPDIVNGKSDMLGSVKIKQEPEDDYTDRDWDRDKDRDRDRHRERSHRRTITRSPSRDKKSSRKHKSRSRSPVHRSHKKKKSKKSDRRSREGSSD